MQACGTSGPGAAKEGISRVARRTKTLAGPCDTLSVVYLLLFRSKRQEKQKPERRLPDFAPLEEIDSFKELCKHAWIRLLARSDTLRLKPTPGPSAYLETRCCSYVAALVDDLWASLTCTRHSPGIPSFNSALVHNASEACASGKAWEALPVREYPGYEAGERAWQCRRPPCLTCFC